jgi:hypothetical protein
MQRVFELAGLLVFFVLRERFSKIIFSVDLRLPILKAPPGSLSALAIPFTFSSP